MLSFPDMHVDIAFYILIDKQSLMVTYSKKMSTVLTKNMKYFYSLCKKKKSDDEFNL